MKRIFGYIIVSLTLAGLGLWVAAQIELTTFAPNTPIKSAEVNENFTSLKTAVEALQAQPGVTQLNTLGGDVELVAGSNVDIAVDSETNQITIASAGTGAGGDITGVTAGTGLSGGGDSGDVSLAVDTDTIQARVASACAAGTAVRTVGADGSVTCEPIREITSGIRSTVWYDSTFRPLTFKQDGDDRAYIRVQDNSPSEYFMQFLLNTPSDTNVSLLTMRSTGSSTFNGDLQVTGTLSKGSGSFKIDHPLDPTQKYLSHSFVESPDMMNVYNGNVVTDAAGKATVTLPDYFAALNRDFRYQLTVIGEFAQAIVAQEIEHNQFVILSDKPNIKVSWQVTGIRQDPYAEANRIEVEVPKPLAEQGTYLHPEAYGLPASRGATQEVSASGTY